MSSVKRAVAFLFTGLLLFGSVSVLAGEKSLLSFISPVPGSTFVSPRTNIIIRTFDPVDARCVIFDSLIRVEGSVTGRHSGKLIVSDDGRTLVFTPSTPFALGEVGAVSLRSGLQVTGYIDVKPIEFNFTVTPTDRENVKGASVLDDVPLRYAAAAKGVGGRSVDGAILPADFPSISVSTLGTTALGNIFLANFAWTSSVVSTPYLMILDNSGNPIFYREMSNACLDFKLQPNGLLTYFHNSENKYFELDSSYAIVDTFECGNGYPTNQHECRILPNGHVLLMSYDNQIVDMSAIVPGGNASATVTGLVIQELDMQKNVVFQWRSWDHFKITDATHENLTADKIDYVHGNALDVDTDGNILLSSRHMDEITKIDRGTGEILWRMEIGRAHV
jgi:hypothetical protein